MNVLLSRVNVVEKDVTLPGRSEVRQAVSTPHQLQLCTVLGDQLTSYLFTTVHTRRVLIMHKW
jgi:hypothetical protein